MIKDFGNSKLPRFKAGQALLDQVTADRLNDICSMIEACRLQNGVGYMLNRSANGTTFTVLENEYNRPPKLWKVGLDDVDLDPATIISKVINAVMDEIINIVSDPGQFTGIFFGFLAQIIDAITSGNAGSASGVKNLIEGVMQPIYQIIDMVDAKVEEIFGKVDPIRSTLENYFATRGKRPRSGDYIYTDELGICYTLFKETTDTDGTYPTPNLIFRVPFSVGKSENGEGGTQFYALTTFPFPDIAECVKTILRAIVKFITSLLGSTFEGIVQAIMDAVAQALYALYELLWEFIEMILEMIAEIFAIIEAIWEAIAELLEELANLNELFDELSGMLDDILSEIAGLQEEDSLLSDLLDEIWDFLLNSPIIEVINSDGSAHLIQVIDEIAAGDLRSNITWIDSDNGMGHRAKTLLWEEAYPNVVNVDWRDLEYVGADGNSYTDKFLMRLDRNSTPTNKVQPTQVQVCENGSSTTKRFLEKK